MKAHHCLLAIAAAAGLGLSTCPQFAEPDADAAQKLAKSSGCTKCHTVDKAKKGPSFQKSRAKYKGKADAEQKLTTHLTTSPKVKFPDGTEEEHDTVDTQGPEAAQEPRAVDPRAVIDSRDPP